MVRHMVAIHRHHHRIQDTQQVTLRYVSVVYFESHTLH